MVGGGEEADVEKEAPPLIGPHRDTNGRADQQGRARRASIHLAHQAFANQTEPSGT